MIFNFQVCAQTQLLASEQSFQILFPRMSKDKEDNYCSDKENARDHFQAIRAYY